MTSALVEGVRMQLKPAGMMDSKVSQKEFLKWREKLGDELAAQEVAEKKKTRGRGSTAYQSSEADQ
jgi:hypothetical protein